MLVKFYLGTHNFWNFTRGYKKTDPRCDRFMIKMSAEKV
jgi:tRNA U38,U39,U40 pseudouridine synthase TruA